ncbi:hypothetical protein INT46_001596 [Mucor plumbeus]|uniref:Uncharacterized protein n=1 Tax=Mucor plumbeus TaxID=97098 RepID=A0A8H7RME7_9FUNG|nr:hypothetical protein INT46_001596 [Mucor plumbeus]
MPSSISSKSTRSSGSSGSSSYSSGSQDCGCSNEAIGAWIFIPLIAAVGMILALTLTQQEPFSDVARDNSEAEFYDGYANIEDVVALPENAYYVDTTLNNTLNDTSSITISNFEKNIMGNTTHNMIKRNFAVKVVALEQLD